VGSEGDERENDVRADEAALIASTEHSRLFSSAGVYLYMYSVAGFYNYFWVSDKKLISNKTNGDFACYESLGFETS
jgi:hypothetical protein